MFQWYDYCFRAVDLDRINVRTQQEGDDIWFFTCRAVAAGEELLLDYGHLYWDEQTG